MNPLAKGTLLHVVLERLNTAFKADPAALHALICNRVPCNEALADHSTFTVDTGMYGHNAGALGLINCALSDVLGTRVAAQFSEPDEFGRCKLVGFQEFLPDKKE